jgi:thiol:disulfide interchange protein DsbA
VKLRILLTVAVLVSAGCGDDQSTAPPAPAVDDSPEAAAQAPEAAPAVAATQPAAVPPPATTLPAASVPAQRDSSTDALAALGYQAGVHYQRLSPTQPTSSSPDQVEVAEFFMYSCVHCYNFEPYVQQWLTRKPAYINFIRVPTVWNPLVRLHGQAFYAAEALGKGAEMHTPFFREMHVTGNLLQTQEDIAEFFSRFDVDEQAFEGAFNSFAVHTKVQRADELTRRYRVEATPSVVVNGKYVTTASMAGGFEQLVDLIEALAQSERPLN